MAAFHPADSTSGLAFEDKKQVIAERLQKREDARQNDILKKKENEGDGVSRQDNVTFFLENLNEKRRMVETEILRSNELTKSELIDHFDSLSDTLHKMQRYVSECTAFLPSYEIRQAKDVISTLQTQIQEKRDELLPKKRFAFSKPKKPTEKKKEQLTESETIEPDEVDSAVELAACKFVNQAGQHLKMQSIEINQKDVAIVDLTDCTVKLYGAPSAVHIFRLKNCHIFCGPVSGSIFIRACTGCVFVLPCQQLRIHNTFDSQFYIHVTSKAIIEDCARVEFAPYNWKYDSLDADYQLSRLDKKRNNWDKVDDFNFLAADVASPNWTVLEESKRVHSWE